MTVAVGFICLELGCPAAFAPRHNVLDVLFCHIKAVHITPLMSNQLRRKETGKETVIFDGQLTTRRTTGLWLLLGSNPSVEIR